MGHKSVLLTLNQKRQFLNLSTFDAKSFLFLLSFYNNIKNLLFKKNIYVSKFFINILSNKIYLNTNLFFGVSFLKRLSRKSLKKSKKLKSEFNHEIFLTKLKKNLFMKFFKNFNLVLKTNMVYMNFNLINKQLNYKLINFLLPKIKRFRRALFDKKTPLLRDTVRIISLYAKSLVDLDTFLSTFALIFSNVYKRNHNKFFLFIQLVFSLFLKELNMIDSGFNTFKGIKFIIKGRLGGDAKASKRCLKFGSIPIQSVDKKVDFTKTNSYTSSLGVFGLKLWIYKI